MGVTEAATARWGVKLAWAAALVLYGSCWLLPITGDSIGFDGALFAHVEFWELITQGPSIDSVGDVFAVIFLAIGWLANEVFVLGVVTYLRWPRIAVRSFAFSLGIMISWQVGFLDEFPLLVGYWFWVAAGAIMLWLAATRLAREKRRGVGAVLAEATAMVLLLAPILNAAMAATFSD